MRLQSFGVFRAFSTFGMLAISGFVLAQSSGNFTARLSWVPISLAQQKLVAGEGSATATLARARLTINGTFVGLPEAATIARLHYGAATGARGPAIAELEVTHATDGAIAGEVQLDREQRAALLAGQLYIQLYAERGVPPDDAVLRGWLLRDTTSASAGRRNER